MHPRLIAALVAGAALLGPVRAFARPPDTPPAVLATRVEQAPSLDGDVLGDRAWQAAPPLTEFWQTTPDDGAPASERTEVRIVHTHDTLYLGVVCYDRAPRDIIVNERRRDASLDDGDSFALILDTYRDRQNGFVFGTNPAGLEYDGQVTNQGEGSGPGSSLGGFNLNWDAAWQVRTRLGEFGWSAEFAIPFRTLRYRGGAKQTWGLNLQRNIRRRNERAFWAPLARQHSLHRLASAGALDGLELPAPNSLRIAPYALAALTRDRGRPTRGDGDVGGELKWGLTPSLTLDATLNTDFAQVEVDEQQINLDRFSLFFPEKRPFFLENAGFFGVGTPGEVDLFFSRRIGLSRRGEPIPILGGARLSGKAGGWSLGLLDMQTRARAEGTPANNFAVARAQRELPNRSGVGVILTNREATGAHAAAGDHNRVVGLDARLGLGRHVDLGAYAARSFTPAARSAQHAAHLSAAWDSPAWTIHGKYTDVGEDFNPEVGFLRRRGYRKPEFLVFHTRRFTSAPLGLLEARPHVSYNGYFKPGGLHESSFLHVDNHLEWRGGWQVHTGVNVVHEGLRERFEIHPGIGVAPGSYDNAEGVLVISSDQGAPLNFELRLTAGGFFDGSRVAVAPELRARVGETFNLYADLEHNDVSLAGGRFVTNLLRLRLSYSFTPRLYAQALVQWNDRQRNVSTNLRLGWLQTANAGLFLVYSQNRDTRRGGLGVRDHTLTLKLSRLFDVLD